MSLPILSQTFTLPATNTGSESWDDAKALETWIRARANRSTNTEDAYKRQADRLLNWMAWKGLQIRLLSVSDAMDYLQHLSDPPKDWIRGTEVSSPGNSAHRRQDGPLSLRSLTYARTVAVQMFGYLCDCGYISVNVFKLTSRPATVASRMQDRHLDLPAWEFLWDHVTVTRPAELEARRHEGEAEDDLARATAIRDRWLLALLYHTGMRKSEVAQGSMGDFIKENSAWLLRVVGKGAKVRLITCNSVMIDELRRYRTGLGLTPLPTPSEQRPLIQHLRRHQPHSVTPRAIGLVIEEIRCAATAACDDPHVCDRINRMSAHWMRHTNATHRLQAGASLVTTQDELGHASINTTRAYTATSSQQRMDDAEKLANLSGRK